MSGDRFGFPPAALVRSRQLSHVAVQWVSRAARANLKPLDDDSHSNLGWSTDLSSLVSHPLDPDKTLQLGFSFAKAALLLIRQGSVVDELTMEDADDSTIQQWCDEHLQNAGLNGIDKGILPYTLSPIDCSLFAKHRAELEVLGDWFAFGFSALEKLVATNQGHAVNTPVVRCWPHHYDVGAIFFLELGDPETARSIGVGLSPGDESYPEPYFYCNPWPAPSSLPPETSPLHWHTKGFTSLILQSSKIQTSTDIDGLLTLSYATVRSALTTRD